MHLFLYIGAFIATLFSNCEARCNFPGHTVHGRVECNSLNLLEGAKCRVVCDRGYKLKGGKEAVCKNGQWTATLGTCEAVICPVPKTSRLTISKPVSCKTVPSPYSTFCELTCPRGYQDQAAIYCNATGQWEGRDVECNDRLGPVIECPQQYTIKVETDPGKARATVRLPSPRYSDNSQSHGGKLVFSAFLDGRRVSVGQHVLTIGRHDVRYIVVDESGNPGKCYFEYRVEDKEPPKFENCPANIIKMAPKGKESARVSWQEPSATDNSGHVRAFSDRPNNSAFYKGTSNVTYHFSDNSGNSAKCRFTVTIKVPCYDRNDFPISRILPSVTTNDACSIPASDLTKCEQSLLSGLPEFKWKHICPKTCKMCS